MMFDENTEVFWSCSVTWRNHFYVFGGYSETRQISKVTGCKLTSIGTLAFDHHYAGCSIVGEDIIYLCFNGNNADDYKKCRSAAEPLGNFTEVPLSNYQHKDIRIASSFSKLTVDFTIRKGFIFRRNFGRRQPLPDEHQNRDVLD